MKKALAIDVGGTKIYSAIINSQGEILSEIEKNPTPKTFDEIKTVFLNIIKKYEDVVDVIAFSTCGAVNNENSGILGSTGNIAKEYPNLKFKELSKKPVFVENDANCAAWAEYKIGASKGCTNSIMLTLGTGVGGGIIVNNMLLKGQNGAAGEMHFKMYSDKRRKCTCGSWDCFEIYASGKGLKLTAEEMTKNPEVTTYDVVEGVKNGNPQMISVLDRWHEDIINGIIGLSNIFDPECVVLSGSMAEFVDVEKIEDSVNSQIVTTPTRIKKATAGNFSGMIGAAILALEVYNG
ncbi:MAG: ROK family protein [Muribaculaceae bacterium]|nr:ROK family protein [Muribaculaceae bacterium]